MPIGYLTDMGTFLNQMNNSGWELFHCYEPNSTGIYVFIFKRDDNDYSPDSFDSR